MFGYTNTSVGESLMFSVTRYDEDTDLSSITGKENEIAVLTNTNFTKWSFLNSLPTNPTNTEIVILVGISDIEIPVFKKENILTYPMYVMQYLNNTWVSKISKLYQNGAWITLNRILFYNGQYVENWMINTSIYNDVNYNSYRGNKGVSASYVNNIININYNGGDCWTGCWASTVESINRDIYTTLNFTISSMTNPGSSSTNGAWLMLASTNSGNLNGKTYNISQLLSAKTYSIDISNINNDFYICFNGGQNCNSNGLNTKYQINKIWLS